MKKTKPATKIRCPKCGNGMQCITPKDKPTKLNGGTLFVMEDMGNGNEEAYDCDISEWTCPDCMCTIYLSEKNVVEPEVDEFDTMG